MVRGGRAVGTKTDMSTSGGRGFGHAGQRQSRQSGGRHNTDGGYLSRMKETIQPTHPARFLSSRFLVLMIGLFLVLVEMQLANWSFFSSATPMLSLFYVYLLALYQPLVLPLSSVWIIAFFAEILGLDLLGVRVIYLPILVIWLTYRPFDREGEDFLSLWAHFASVCLVIALWRLGVFLAVHLTIPDLSEMALQTGLNIIFFPVIFVVMFFLNSLVSRMNNG